MSVCLCVCSHLAQLYVNPYELAFVKLRIKFSMFTYIMCLMFVKLRITFSIFTYIMSLMFVQRFEPQCWR